MEYYREPVRWAAVALAGYVGVIAYTCPCRTIFGCHRASASVAVLALALLTLASSGAMF